MRKIYLIFILIFAIFIGLELNFKPSKSIENIPFSKTVTEHKTKDVQQASVFGLDTLVSNDFYPEQNSPETITWSLLGKIKYENREHKDYPDGVMYPLVNEELKAKKGKKISISGFIIPIDNENYALSKNVFAQCFFCGQAGPETIMGIKFKDLKKRLKTDQYVTLEGTFRYNETDVEDWIYHIENAIITKGG
ncbi:MAG: hypothetical protein WCY06_02730 [Flavobacteriaceae bacterium]